MVPTRRNLLRAAGGAALLGAAGCLEDVPAHGRTATPTESCTAAEPPRPDTGDGRPDPRPYPEGPPAFEPGAVAEFSESFERAYAYNDMLASFEDDGNCVTYLELYVVGDETTVEESDRGYEVTVRTRGSYTGTPCGTATGTETPTPLPHVDRPPTTTRYRVGERALVRKGSVVVCW